MLRLVTGWEFPATNCARPPGGSSRPKKLFNIRAGWRPAEDTLPARFSQESPEDDANARLRPKELQEAIVAYNLHRGWSAEGNLGQLPGIPRLGGLVSRKYPLGWGFASKSSRREPPRFGYRQLRSLAFFLQSQRRNEFNGLYYDPGNARPQWRICRLRTCLSISTDRSLAGFGRKTAGRGRHRPPDEGADGGEPGRRAARHHARRSDRRRGRWS